MAEPDREQLLEELACLRQELGRLTPAGRAIPCPPADVSPGTSESLALLDTLFSTAPVGLALVDRELRYLRVNEMLAQMNGRSVGAHLGRTIGEVVPDLSDAVQPIARRVIDQGEAVKDVEITCTTAATGEAARTWLTDFYPVRAADGALTGIGIVVLDITDRKRIELALRESDAKFHALASQSPVGIFQTDTQGACSFVSERWCALSGLNAADALGQGWIRALHPADRDRVSSEWRRATAEGRDHATEYRFLTPDARTVWVSARAVALRGPSGEARGYVGTVMDVTDLRQSIEQLAAQRAFLRQVIDLDPNFIFAKDRQGQFRLVNKAVAEAYGTTVENLIGKTDADFNPDAAEVEHFREDDLEVMNSRREKLVPEEKITDASGRTRYLQTIKRAIVSPDGSVDMVLGVSADISARKTLEAQLSQAQKMEAVGRLAGGVAHDFNNLLTVVLGSAEMILHGLPPEHPVRVHAGEIRAAAERAAMLTQQLLAFSRKQVLRPQVLDLNQVVVEIREMLGRLIGEDIELVTMLDPALGSVRADPGQLSLVILNLAINSRDAMPKGGRLIVETSNLSFGGADPSVQSEMGPGEYVLLTVTDTGLGIPADTLMLIFEPFFTTKEPGRGTGLGLATSYGIVRQSGGYIRVYSEVGHGTTFRIYLPRVQEATATLDHPAAGPIPRGTETVLLVEDEAMVRQVAARNLRERGFHVIEAQDGADALVVLAGHSGPIDILVTDVVMPRMGGADLAARVRQARPGIRVLYTSGYTENALLRAGDPQSGPEFLSKPYTHGALVRRVREVLDRTAG